MILPLRVICTALLVLGVPLDGDMPRYVFINKAPGVEWRQDVPETFTCQGFEEIVHAVNAPEDPALRIGVAFFFSILEGNAETLSRSLRALLKASEESGVPVLITLDGQQWWSGRPELWNWWDPKKPGYKPDNVYNVEWTGWDPASAVKICWRNWGSQIRVAPAPNIASPKFIEANLERLDILVPIIAAWRRSLPEDKQYLLGGVKVGNEAGTGYNAYHYPNGNRYLEQWPDDASHDPKTGVQLEKGLSGGLAQLGYAAVKTAGVKDVGEITRDDLGKVTQQYLAALARKTHECGIPRDLIYVHQGGTYPPWGTHIPFWPAFNEWSTPAWSFYGLDPNAIDELSEELNDADRTRWAAGEWWWGASDKAGWYDHFERTLRFHDCRFVAVYNWNCGYRFKEDKAGQIALRDLVAHWREH